MRFSPYVMPSQEEVMQMSEEEQVPIVLQDLPTTVRGFCCLGSDYEPIIVINSRMTAEQQRKTIRHELDHIRRGDIWNEDYTDATEYGDAI